MTVTFSTPGVAQALGVSVSTVSRLASVLHGREGSGHHHRLSPTDVKVIRAWVAINDHGDAQNNDPLIRRLRRIVRLAIEAQPRRYLLITTPGTDPVAETFQLIVEVIQAWERRGGVGWCIDLEPGT